MRRLPVPLLAVLLAACSALDAPPPDTMATTTTDPPTTTTTTTIPTTTTTERVCDPDPRPIEDVLDPTDPVGVALVASAATFECADTVAVIAATPDAVATAVAEHGGTVPILIAPDGPTRPIVDEINRLDPVRLVAIDLPAADFEPLGREVEAIESTAQTGAAPLPSSGDGVWLLQGGEPWLANLVGHYAAARGETVIVVDGGDLRATPDEVRERIRVATSVTVVTARPRLEIDALLRAPLLPTSDLLLFDDERMIAFYGNPTTPALGVLGEQGVTEAIDRLLPIAAEYATDGVDILPGFEIIATVASARAGEDGDYSDETSIETLRPWVEAAGNAGVYVVLDLQPGRTDFLTQARRYEEFLRLPHVGLALDPEWRLGPNQVHLRQIGRVEAAEVNEVSEWLAGIVREETLPQKLFLLHQFNLSMLQDRDQIEFRPELATVIQMDGQGPLGAKYGTWNAIRAGADERFLWGWKNFYDEDSPTATPAQVLDLDPIPVFVSYQ